MNESGWRLAGQKPEPADDSREIKPRRKPRWTLIALACAAAAIASSLIMQAILSVNARQPSERGASITKEKPLTPVPTPQVGVQPAQPGVVSPTANQIESHALETEAARLRRENQELRSQLSQQEAAISFVSGGGKDDASGQPMTSRTFALNPGSVLALAKPQAADRAQSALVTLREQFAHVGAQLSPPASVVLSPAADQLMVHASEPEMASVERTLSSLGLMRSLGK